MIQVLFMLYAFNEIYPMPTKFFVIAWVFFIVKVIGEFIKESKDK